MMTSDSYIEYKELLTDQYQPHLQYRGESVIRRIHGRLKDESAVWIIWDKKDGLECCRGIKTGDSFSISKVVDLIDFPELCGIGPDSILDSKISSWLNLCHYEDEEGVVHYDSYYDRYPIKNDAGKEGLTVRDLRSAVNHIISENLPFQPGDTVILDGALSQSNLIKHLLQKYGCHVHAACSDEVSNEAGIVPGESTAQINLFMIGLQSVTVVPMPTGRELAVYDVPSNQKQITEPPTMKLLRCDSDLLGNLWLATQNADGSTVFRLHTEGEVEYSEIKSK